MSTLEELKEQVLLSLLVQAVGLEVQELEEQQVLLSLLVHLARLGQEELAQGGLEELQPTWQWCGSCPLALEPCPWHCTANPS